MLDFVARRLVAIIPVLAVVAIFVFLMLRLTPGDPAAVIAGDNATSDQIDAIRSKLGLNEPIWTQFAIWIGDVLRGNFGESFFFKKTVAELIAQSVEPTLALVDLHPDHRASASPCRSACWLPTNTARWSTASSWPSRCWASRCRPSSSAIA